VHAFCFIFLAWPRPLPHAHTASLTSLDHSDAIIRKKIEIIDQKYRGRRICLPRRDLLLCLYVHWRNVYRCSTTETTKRRFCSYGTPSEYLIRVSSARTTRVWFPQRPT